jgi:hypothetical protein
MLVNSFWSGIDYVVDTYSIDVAYSLRKIASSTTNVCRVRRASDSAESDFTADEITDGTLLTWGGSSAFIAKWYNQGSTGVTDDLIQATAGDQPSIIISSAVTLKDGLPCPKYLGGTDQLYNASPVIPSAGSASTIWYVSHSTQSNYLTGAFCTSPNNANNRFWAAIDTLTTAPRNYTISATTTNGTSTASSVRDDSNNRLITLLTDASKNMSSWDNSTAGGTDSFAGTYTNSSLYLGTLGSSNGLQGGLQEFLMKYADASSDRVAIQDDINTYYSIYSPYVLDEHSGATIGLALHKLKSTATNCIRVRRSSDNAEQDIGFVGFDLDTASLETFCSATDGYVTTVYDQEGSNNATQTTSASQPKIVTSGTTLVSTNGKPAMLFDGSDDYFDLTSTIATTQLFYNSAVFDRLTAGILSITMATTSSATPYSLYWTSGDAIYTAFTNAGTLHNSSQTQTGDLLNTILRNSSDNVKMWENGSSKTTKTYANTVLNFDSWGRRNSNYHSGYMQELLYWNTDQENNRKSIEGYTNDYYSIY